MEKTGKRILATYYGITFFYKLFLSFTFSTYVLFLIERGLNLFEVGFVNFFFMAGTLVFMIPIGAFADTFGRKFSSVIGCFISFAGLIIYFFSTTFRQFAVAELILALGLTFFFGAFRAWMVDALKSHNSQHQFSKVFSKEEQILNIAALLGGLIGGYLARGNLALPWLAASFGSFAIGILAIIVIKEEGFREKLSLKDKFKDLILTAKKGLKTGAANKNILYIMTLGAIAGFFFQPMNMYWQPRFKEFIDDTAMLGWIFFGISLALIAGNRFALVLLGKIKEKKNALAIIQIVIGLQILIVSLFSSFVPILIFFLFHEFGRGAGSPISTTYLNENADKELRATIFSFEAMAVMAGSAFGLLVFGAIAQNISIQFSWFVSGLGLISATGIAYLIFSKKD